MKIRCFISSLLLLFFCITCYAGPVTPYGDIYNKNSWSSNADFITNGNTSATVSGSYIDISSATTYNWNNIVNITGYQTKLEKWVFKARFKIVAWASNSYGIGFGLKSANPVVKNDVMGFIQTANTGTGGLYIVKTDQTVLSTGAAPLGVALNDVIDVEAVFYDSVFTFKAVNITSGNMASVNYTYACNGSTAAVPNTSYFSILELGGTHQIQNIEISSTEKTNANLVTIGDSKTIGYFTNTFSGRYTAQLNNNYPSTVINAGGGDGITQVLNRIPELQRLAPSKFLLSIGSNDLRFGGNLNQLKTDYISLVNTLMATGAQVYHIVLPEDYSKALAVQGTALIDFKNWVQTTYPAYYINVWDSLATANYLKGMYDTGDGVHLNQAANNKTYEAIVASGKLSGGSLPVSLINFSVKKRNNQALLSWQTSLTSTAENYIIEKSRDKRSFNPVAAVRSNSSAVYNYTDENNETGNTYYRLKITETNGSISYSHMVVFSNKTEALQITGSHWINEEQLSISIRTAAAGFIQWQITDINGRKIAFGKQKLNAGNNQLPIQGGNYKKGIYYFNLISNTNEELPPLTIVK